MRLKLKNIEIGHEQIKVFHKAPLVLCLIVFHNRTIAGKPTKNPPRNGRI